MCLWTNYITCGITVHNLMLHCYVSSQLQLSQVCSVFLIYHSQKCPRSFNFFYVIVHQSLSTSELTWSFYGERNLQLQISKDVILTPYTFDISTGSNECEFLPLKHRTWSVFRKQVDGITALLAGLYILHLLRKVLDFFLIVCLTVIVCLRGSVPENQTVWGV